MLLINNPHDCNYTLIKNAKAIVLTYNFLTIYGFPYCNVYSKKLLNSNFHLILSLETKSDAATATLAVIDSFPALIIDPALYKVLNTVKVNASSKTKLFINLQQFKEDITA